jgi:putative ABC transport system substrate-binding protein
MGETCYVYSLETVWSSMGTHMRRREFIAGFGGAAATWPIAVRAQQRAMPVIGVLHPRSEETSSNEMAAFHQGLKETGYVEGQNLRIEHRSADAQYDRLPALAADFVQRRVTVIVAMSASAARAARAATSTIPIVFQAAADPVQFGLIASLNRPGGNVTGVTNLNLEVGPKLLELLHELIPAATIMALLFDPASPNAEILSRDLRTAAQTLGLQLHILPVSNEHDFDSAFATLTPLRAGGLVIATQSLFTGRMERLAALAARHPLPAISAYRGFAAAGGLMSYGGSLTETYRQVGLYTGRILKGEKPADLPVQQATKVELVINLKAAKALGLTIPITLLGRADEVIE